MANEEIRNSIVSDLQNLPKLQNEQALIKNRKQARAIVMREMRAQQSQDIADEWKLRVEIARIEYKYDHENILTLITRLVSDVQDSVEQSRKLKAIEKPTSTH
jgi:hypothetical protein